MPIQIATQEGNLQWIDVRVLPIQPTMASEYKYEGREYDEV